MSLSMISIAVLIAGILNAVLGIAVLIKAPKRKLGLVFSLCAFIMAIWAFELFLFQIKASPSPDFWIRVTYSTVWVMNILFVYLSFLFPFEAQTRLLKIILPLLSFILLIFIYLIFLTDKFIEKTTTYDSQIDVALGPAHLGFQIGSSFCYAIFGWNIFRKLKATTGLEKHQLKLLMAGIFFYSIPVVILTVILPTFFHNTRSLALSPITSFIFTGFITYAIIRHRFLDIRMVLHKLLVQFLVALLMIALFIAYEFFVEGGSFDTLKNPLQLVAMIIATMLFINILPGIIELVTKFVGKYLITGIFDYSYARQEISKGLNVIVGLEDVLLATIKELNKFIQPKYIAIFAIFPKSARESLCGFEIEKEKLTQSEDLPSEMVSYFNGKKSILVYEEFKRNIDALKDPEMEKVLQWLNKKHIEIVYPFYSENKLIGVLILGEKISGEPYTVQDIEFIENISMQISISVSRAFLFEQVQDLAQNLELKVTKATKELQDKVEALQLARQRESDLLDILGHELRTPLSIIKNAIGLIRFKKQKGALTDKDIDRNIDAAEESLGREIKIVDTLLGAAKLEAKKVETHSEVVDIIDVIEDGLAAHKREIAKKKLKADFKKPKEGFPSVYADRTKIQEVFDNLLSNAVKYTSKGGVEIFLKQDENFVYVAIKDTGIGIPEEELNKLGTKFYRVKQYLQKGGRIRMVRPGGSGLGLYVTYGYVKAMGGDVKVKSKVGKGSTFTFSVPKYKGQKIKIAKGREKDVFKRMGLKK